MQGFGHLSSDAAWSQMQCIPPRTSHLEGIAEPRVLKVPYGCRTYPVGLWHIPGADVREPSSHLFFVFCCFVVCLCSPCWPGICSLVQAGFKLLAKPPVTLSDGIRSVLLSPLKYDPGTSQSAPNLWPLSGGYCTLRLLGPCVPGGLLVVSRAVVGPVCHYFRPSLSQRGLGCC